MTNASGTAPEPHGAADPPAGTGENPAQPYRPTGAGTPGWSPADPGATGEQATATAEPTSAAQSDPATGDPATGDPATGDPASAGLAHGQGAAPAAARPFAGIPASDYVRDGASALLLLVSLTRPWDATHFASERVEVVLVTVLSLLSLAVPYLARVDAFPASWTVHTTRRVRLLANVPYFLLVAVYLVLDAVGGDWGGVGAAVGLGLAGAVLAAQPRQSELGPVDADAAVGVRWLQSLLVLAGVLGVTLVASLVFTVVPRWIGTESLLFVVASVLFVAALFALPVLGVLRRVESARLTLVGLGGALVAVTVLGSESVDVFVESMRAGNFGLVLIPAAGAVAVSPAVRRTMRGAQPVSTWVGVGVRGFDLIVVTGVYVLVFAVLALSFIGSSGLVFVAIAVGLLAAGLAVVGRLALSRDAVRGRATAIAVGVAVALLGAVLYAVTLSEGSLGVPSAVLLLAFGLPAVVVVALTVPREVRDYVHASPTYAPIAGRAYVWQPPAPKPARVAPQPGAYAGQGAYPAQQQGYAGAQQGPAGAPPAGQPDRTASRVLPAPAGYPAGAESTSVLPAYDPAQQGYAQYAPTQQYGQGSGGTGQYGPEQQGYAQSQPTQVQPSQPQPTQVQPDQPAQAGAPAGQYGGYPTPGVSAPPTQPMQGFTASQAADPTTPLEVLAQIVQDAPHLRPQVAANPSTYPALLGWLAALGDPAVDAALRSRQ